MTARATGPRLAATLERLGLSDAPLIGEAACACRTLPRRGRPLRPATIGRDRPGPEPGLPGRTTSVRLADFRASRYDGAVEHLGESLKLGTTWASWPLNYPVLAMVHHRLGHGDESRRWLEKAHGLCGDAAHGLKQGESRKSSAVWWDYVEFGLTSRGRLCAILRQTSRLTRSHQVEERLTIRKVVLPDDPVDGMPDQPGIVPRANLRLESPVSDTIELD